MKLSSSVRPAEARRALRGRSERRPARLRSRRRIESAGAFCLRRVLGEWILRLRLRESVHFPLGRLADRAAPPIVSCLVSVEPPARAAGARARRRAGSGLLRWASSHYLLGSTALKVPGRPGRRIGAESGFCLALVGDLRAAAPAPESDGAATSTAIGSAVNLETDAARPWRSVARGCGCHDLRRRGFARRRRPAAACERRGRRALRRDARRPPALAPRAAARAGCGGPAGQHRVEGARRSGNVPPRVHRRSVLGGPLRTRLGAGGFRGDRDRRDSGGGDRARPAGRIHGYRVLHVFFGGPFIAGRIFRHRREREQELVEHATTLELEQELRAEEAVAEERSRIARELHDVVAHAISVIVLQARGGRRMLDRAPGGDPRGARCDRARRRAGPGRDAQAARHAARGGRAGRARAAAEPAPARRARRTGQLGRAARRGHGRGDAGRAAARCRRIGVPDRAGGAHERAQARGTRSSACVRALPPGRPRARGRR